MVTLEFIHVPNGETEEHGPFEFVQVTYGDIRVGPEGETFIAHFSNGYWIDGEGKEWTDFTIYAAK